MPAAEPPLCILQPRATAWLEIAVLSPSAKKCKRRLFPIVAWQRSLLPVELRIPRFACRQSSCCGSRGSADSNQMQASPVISPFAVFSLITRRSTLRRDDQKNNEQHKK